MVSGCDTTKMPPRVGSEQCDGPDSGNPDLGESPLRAHRQVNLRLRAHGGPPVLRAESSWTLHPRAPAFDSVHLFANHSSGLSVVRLELDAEIDRVSAYARCEDQGWGGTGSAGAVLALYDEAEEHVLAYSVCALTDHGTQDLRWSLEPPGQQGDDSANGECEGAHWPAKGYEKSMGNVCAQARPGMVLHLKVVLQPPSRLDTICPAVLLRAHAPWHAVALACEAVAMPTRLIAALLIQVFTPNWAGWSVTCTEASLQARRAEDKRAKMTAFMGALHARLGQGSSAALLAATEAGHDVVRSVLWPLYSGFA